MGRSRVGFGGIGAIPSARVARSGSVLLRGRAFALRPRPLASDLGPFGASPSVAPIARSLRSLGDGDFLRIRSSWRKPRGRKRRSRSRDIADGVGAAVFLVVGEKDQRTPPWMSEKILALLKGPKELWIVPGAGHGGSSAPEYTGLPEFFDRLAAFFGMYLKRS